MKWWILLVPAIAWAQPEPRPEAAPELPLDAPVPVDPETEKPVVDRMLEEPSDATPPGETVEITRRVAAQIIPEYVELRKGPGPAYVSVGRAYGGDRVIIKRKGPDRRWIEVEAGGLRGWIKLSQVKIERERVRRGRDGATDTGRDRRQTNYAYDGQGRRVSLDGRPVGSGEGTDGPNALGDDEIPEIFRTSATPKLRVHFGAGIARIGREFASSITNDGEGESALTKLDVTSTAIAYELGVLWTPIDYFAAAFRFRDARFAETQIPASANFGFQQAFALSMDAQQIELDAIGRYPVGQFSFGAYAGLHVLRQAFQATQPYPLFLTNTYISLGAGAVATAAFGPIDVQLRGGVVLPLTISQDPVGSGDPKSTGADLALELAYNLSSAWAIWANAHFQQLDTDFTGPSEHVDTVTGAAPRSYDQAKEKDKILGGGLGVRWSY